MTIDIERIFRDAEDLSVQERARLVRRLIASLDQTDETGAEQAWLDEAERRAADFRAGRSTAKPGAEVFDALLNQS